MTSVRDNSKYIGHEPVSAAQDPFYLVKEEVQSLVDSVQKSFKRWEQLSGTLEGSQLGKDIVADCTSIEWQVDELDKAIAVSERDPARYGLDSIEISQRKRWTGLARSQISTIKKLVQDSQSNGAGTRVEMMRMPMNPSSQKVNFTPSSQKGNLTPDDDDEFYAAESDRQALLMKEQDQDLDELSASVERLGDVGLTIHDELISQDRIIDDLGREMDNTANRLDFVQKKVAHVIKRAGAKGQIMMIVFLVILLLVLILLVFS
ncbi:hypothetical protein KP509_09G068800 [Ceratopteris richardii]|uniref:t-SNARE coiled-coil homology domain-containing protein n=1 Tax=Ceratopteris richardii TaxID=49495 RepID=A0A8T2UBI4_CERRI|nr:hypothetical protein KP509_09G068800 [Ceratopteris richardii]KAH7429859.1 hypothetical protein KP509_09G068800 [Ceratopteris richardii]